MHRKLFFDSFLMYLTVLLLPIAALGTVIFVISLNYVNNTLSSRNDMVFRQGVQGMDKTLAQMEAINLNLSIRSDVARKVSAALNHPEGGIPSDDYFLASTVVNMLLAVSSSNEFIHSIYLYVPNDYNMFIDSNIGIRDIAHHADTS